MHQDAAFRDTAIDPIAGVAAFLERSAGIALAAGVPRANIILDPGIGFAKTHAQNLALLARLGELRSLGFPLLLGASRKSVIGNVLALPPDDRLEPIRQRRRRIPLRQPVGKVLHQPGNIRLPQQSRRFPHRHRLRPLIGGA